MAGSGRRVFQPGEVLTASNVMSYLQDQAVMSFAGTAARGTALATPFDGAVTYLQDSNSIEVYKTTGTAVAGYEPINMAQSPNAIINGAFEINQRGFSSSTGNDLYGFDRWKYGSITGTVTHSSQTFTPGDITSTSFEGKNFHRIVTTGQTGTTARATIQQPIEDVRSFAGQTVTVSFWARAGSGTPNISVEFFQNFGTGGSPSASVSGSIANNSVKKVAVSTGWVRYIVTLSVPSILGKVIGTNNDSSLILVFWVSAGTDFATRTDSIGIQSNTFDIWGVQVEEGQTATPFRRNANSIQGELAACQRYYFNSGTVFYQGYIGYSTDPYRRNNLPFPVSLRRTPTAADMSYTWNTGTPGADGYTPNNVRIYTNIGNTTGEGQVLSYTVNVEL